MEGFFEDVESTFDERYETAPSVSALLLDAEERFSSFETSGNQPSYSDLVELCVSAALLAATIINTGDR